LIGFLIRTVDCCGTADECEDREYSRNRFHSFSTYD
jgi:hypothetical protein